VCAQLAHAAGETGPGHYVVILAAKSEQHLLQIERKLQQLEIKHKSIREPDPPFNGSITAIGIYPVIDRKLVRKVTSKLQLLKELKNGDRS